MKKDFVSISDFEDWRKRLEKLEEDHEKLDKKSKKRKEKLKKKIKKEEDEREEEDEKLRKMIKEAVTADVFDSEIENLKNLINSLGQTSGDGPKPIVQTGPSISTKELNELRDAMKRLKELEDRLKGFDPSKMPASKGGDPNLANKVAELEKKLEELTQAVASFVKDINPAFQAMELRVVDTSERLARVYADLIEKYEFEEMKEQVEQLLKDVDILKKAGGGQGDGISGDVIIQITNRIEKVEVNVQMLTKQMEEMRNAKPAPQTIAYNETKETIGDEVIKEIQMRINMLIGDVDTLKKEFAKWIKDFQDQLNTKADLESLQSLEKSLMERINDIVKALTKQLADKNDTKKALKLLERQLKNLYDLFMSRGGGSDNEDDAMFTKKPLGGMSCASCEKDIINLQGRKADYLPWNKLPYRDPAERIARVGQGFSKMLSMINPDTLSRYDNSG